MVPVFKFYSLEAQFHSIVRDLDRFMQIKRSK